jgi:hypothetical protein
MDITGVGSFLTILLTNMGAKYPTSNIAIQTPGPIISII